MLSCWNVPFRGKKLSLLTWHEPAPASRHIKFFLGMEKSVISAWITAVLHHTNMLSFDLYDLFHGHNWYLSLNKFDRHLEKSCTVAKCYHSTCSPLLLSKLTYCVGALLLWGLEKVTKIQRKNFFCICVSQCFQQDGYFLYFRSTLALCKYFLGICEVSFCFWGGTAGKCILLCRTLLQFSVGDYTCSSCSIIKEEQENIQNTCYLT